MVGSPCAPRSRAAHLIPVAIRSTFHPHGKEGLRPGGWRITRSAGRSRGLYFTWQGQKLTRDSTRDQLEQARKSQEQTQRLTERGQITDRFTRAIDQLGKTDGEGNRLFEIRLGGIYALERIARESEEDHWPIMEVLTAYVRQHAPLRPEEGQGDEADAATEKLREFLGGESKATEVPPLDPDIQAIMTIIGRRTRSFHHEEPEFLDLHKTNLSGASLPEANLSGANLLGAHLSGTHLLGANLLGANLLQEQLGLTTGDKYTQLPPDLKPPENWNAKTDE